MRFKCLRALLVVQQERLRRACSGIPFVDGRCSNQGSVSIRLAIKRRHADLHFMNLYFREGETMPTRCLLERCQRFIPDLPQRSPPPPWLNIEIESG
jgi:hypothetical protein